MSVVSAVVVIVFAFLIALCRKQRRPNLGAGLDRVLTLAVATDTRGQQRAPLGACRVGVIVAAVLADQARVEAELCDIAGGGQLSQAQVVEVHGEILEQIALERVVTVAEYLLSFEMVLIMF